MTWPPRTGFDASCGCVWLPRFIDKARKCLSESAAPGDLLEDGYMFGENDYMDAQLLAFLNLTTEQILGFVRDTQDDSEATQRILNAAEKSEGDCAKWSIEFLKRSSLFLNMMDADEGRLQPESVSAFLRTFYNEQVVKPATKAYVAKIPNKT